MHYAGWDRVGVFGCGKQLIEVPWEYEPPIPSPYVTLCTYTPALGSWAHCVDQVASENAIDPSGIFESSTKFVNIICGRVGGGLAQYQSEDWKDILKNATAYIQPAPTLDHHDIGVSYPINLEEDGRKAFISGVHAEFLNLDESNNAGLWIYYYFLFVVFLYAMFKILSYFMQKNLKIWPTHKSLTQILARLKSKFLVPTAWLSSTHSQTSSWALGGWIPTAEESLVLSGYLFTHTLALVLNYSIDYHEILESVLEQRLQAMGNRSGILAFAQLPLLMTLTTRSSLLMHFTGFKYSTLILLHRWIGRVVILDSILHTIAFYIHTWMEGTLMTAQVQFWWVAGIIATIITILIGALGVGAFRRKHYELFLYTHIGFALIFLYECWLHAKMFGWLNWLRVSIILWGLERFYRLLLIMKNGMVYAVMDMDLSSKPDSGQQSETLITLIMPKPKRWHMRPSQYAFVYFMLPSVFWQSHPFTVTSDGDTLKLVIAVKEGATLALQKKLYAKYNGQSSIQVPILLEGPYGVPPPVCHYDSTVLIGGGTGVPGPLALALSTMDKLDKGLIHLIVVVRDWVILDAYRPQLEAIKAAGIHFDIYYTGKQAETHWHQFCEIKYGRPNIQGIVEDMCTRSFNHSNTIRNIGVVCCGPPSLNDSTRNIVACATNKHADLNIEFSEEYQVW